MAKSHVISSPQPKKKLKRKHQISLTSFFGKNSNSPTNQKAYHQGSNLSQYLSQDPCASRFGVCPICELSFPLHLLHQHTEVCIDLCSTENKKEAEKAKISDNEQIDFEKNLEARDSNAKITKIFENEEKKHLDCDTPSGKNNKENESKCDDEIKKLSNENENEVKENVDCWWKRTRLSHIDRTGFQLENRQNSISYISEPVPGLFVYEDFITEEEERIILAALDDNQDRYTLPHNMENIIKHNLTDGQPVQNPWKSCNFNGKHFGKRWGVHCNPRDRRVSAPQHPLPPFLTQTILPRLRLLEIFINNRINNKRLFSKRSKCSLENANEANAIDYRRKMGHSLTPHVDDRQMSKEPIANISLAGDCYMTFTNVKEKIAPDEKKVLLKRRTLQILTGSSRYDYSHGIKNSDILSDRRVSITIRESPLTT